MVCFVIMICKLLFTGCVFQIKYNTSFIASSNGSVKLVRRDRSRIVVKDSGELNYFPASTWDDMVSSMYFYAFHFGLLLR